MAVEDIGLVTRFTFEGTMSSVPLHVMGKAVPRHEGLAAHAALQGVHTCVHNLVLYKPLLVFEHLAACVTLVAQVFMLKAHVFVQAVDVAVGHTADLTLVTITVAMCRQLVVAECVLLGKFC